MLCSLRPYICESWIIKFVSPLEAVPECSFQSVVLRTLQLVPSVGLKQQTDFKQGLHSCRSEVSRMGHQTSKIPFVHLMHHFLKQYGVNLPEEQLTSCYQTVFEYNPWFPEEGTLDLQTWTRVKNNVLKAYRRGKNSPTMVGNLVSFTGCYGTIRWLRRRFRG